MLYWIFWTYRWQHETLSKTLLSLSRIVIFYTVTHQWAAPWGARMGVEWLIFCTGDGISSHCVQVTTVYSNFYCLASVVKCCLYVALHRTGCQDWAGGVHQPAADWAQVVSTALPGAISQGVVVFSLPNLVPSTLLPHWLRHLFPEHDGLLCL